MVRVRGLLAVAVPRIIGIICYIGGNLKLAEVRGMDGRRNRGRRTDVSLSHQVIESMNQ